MIVQLFLKIARWLFFFILFVIVLLCTVFALLQTGWGKEKIREKILFSLKEAGIEATMGRLGGQMPFSWTVDQADLSFQNKETLTLSNLKFRIAILPLIRGKVSVNYLHVDEGTYTFQRLHLPKSNLRAEIQKKIQTIALPFPIALDYFAIERMSVLSAETSFVFGAKGAAKVSSTMQEFHFDLTIFAPESNKNYLEASFTGSYKNNFIASRLQLNFNPLPPFLSNDVEGDLIGEFSLRGSWKSWEEILYDRALSGDPLTGQAKGRVDRFHLPLLGQNWKFKTHFSLASMHDISIQNFLIQGNALQFKGIAELHKDPEQCTALAAFSAPDLSLLTTPFPLSGNLMGKVILKKGDFKASFETKNLILKTVSLGTVQGILKGAVSGHQWQADAKLSSADASFPFETCFSLHFIPKESISITDFRLNAEGITAQGDIDYTFSDHLYQGDLTAHIQELGVLSALLKEETLAGSLNAELLLSSEENEQSAKGAIVCKNIQYQEILIDNLSASFAFPRDRLNVLAEKVYTPALYLDRMTFGTYFDEIHWPFYLDVEGRIETPFECYAKGFWNKENTLLTLELTKFFGTLAEVPFALNYPTQLEWEENALNLSPFDLKMGRGRLFSTFELNPTRSVGKWEFQHFPLEIFSCLRPRFGLSGFVSGSGFIDATEDNLEGTFQAKIEEANILHFGKKQPLRAKGSVQAHINHCLAQIHTTLSATEKQFLDCTASLPIQYERYPLKVSLDKTKKTSAELLAEGNLQDLFDFINLGTNHVTGLLSCRLFLSQTLDSPSLQGELTLQNGTYENYLTGIALRQINAQFQAQNDQIRMLHFTAKDDRSGTAEGQGKLLLKPEEKFPYSFEAEMKHLHAVRFDMIDCDLTGPVYFTGDTRHMLAQGNLLIDEANIQINERLPYEIPTLPVTYINTPKHLFSKTLPKGPGFEFSIDLDLTSEGKVKVEGRGLNAELEGNLHVHGTNTSIAAAGSLELIKGEYIFSGKVFKLNEGDILFSDTPTPSAYLNISGTMALPDTTVTATMRGPLRSPQLTFQSNPHISTSAILARILFNKDIADINHPEAIQLASTLISLSDGAGPDVLDTIRKSIGIDRLNISSKPGTDELAVQIGKYLTRGIMITLSQSATSSQVIVEVELPKGFIFQAETQEQEEGKFTLKWRKTY